MRKIYLLMAICLMGTAAVSADSGVSNVRVHDVTNYSAIISFDTSSDSCDVRYKMEDKGGLSYGFNKDLEGWDPWDLDYDGFNWEWGSSGSVHTHRGAGCLISASYDNPTKKALTPNNWIYSPEITLGHTVTLWARGQSSKMEYAVEHFSVYAGTDGQWNDADKVGEGTTINEYQRYDFDISHLNGQTGQIAIRHHNSTDQYLLNIDDVTIYRDGEYPGDAEWTESSVFYTNKKTLISLKPAATYTVQVRAKGRTDWSDAISFTTLPEKPEECEVTGVGAFEDVVHSQINASEFGTIGRLDLGFFTDEYIYYDQEGQLVTNGRTGKFYAVAIYPERLNSLCGMYNLDDESGVVTITNGQISFDRCISGEVIISLNEEKTAYEVVCSMKISNSETLEGVISGMCADEIDPYQGIEGAQNTEHRAQKIIRNGQLFIERNGKTFNAQGAEVR